MKRKSYILRHLARDIDTFLILSLAVAQDPMRRREEFAVSLRKQRKDKIINERRKRLMTVSRPGD